VTTFSPLLIIVCTTEMPQLKTVNEEFRYIRRRDAYRRGYFQIVAPVAFSRGKVLFPHTHTHTRTHNTLLLRVHTLSVGRPLCNCFVTHALTHTLCFNTNSYSQFACCIPRHTHPQSDMPDAFSRLFHRVYVSAVLER
jgi:hypothetical protein